MGSLFSPVTVTHQRIAGPPIMRPDRSRAAWAVIGP